jgi:hypothetical protein
MVTPEELRELIAAYPEWLLIRGSGQSFPLFANELEITSENAGRTLVGFMDDNGFHSWGLNGFKFHEGAIELDVAGPFALNREVMRLVPRESASVLAAAVELARLEKANEVARLIETSIAAIKIIRVDLNAENGRLGQIIYERQKQRLAVLLDVTGAMTPEAILTAAIAWLEKLAWRSKHPITDVLIVAETRQAKALQKLHALLSGRWKAKITVGDISRKKEPACITELPKRKIRDLCREKTKKLYLPRDHQPSDTAIKLTELAPDKIDIVYSKQGETLRFKGLPFARVRSLLGKEKAWIGVNKARRLLTSENWNEAIELFRDLEKYRSAFSENVRHEYYRTSPEAWLESILRRDIRKLDGNLILSPIYNQFRSSNNKIDLLALRRDGRLVVIELKTQPDREMIFQAADYWRKIELQRRRGVLQEADLFDGRDILDETVLVYLVAPALSFHRDYEFFARTLAPEIELWRFELHENWRAEIKVLARREFRDQFAGFTNL